jgi:hypothetical protein
MEVLRKEKYCVIKFKQNYSISLKDMIKIRHFYCFVNSSILSYRSMNVISGTGMFVPLQIQCVRPLFCLLEMDLQFISAHSAFLCNK